MKQAIFYLFILLIFSCTNIDKKDKIIPKFFVGLYVKENNEQRSEISIESVRDTAINFKIKSYNGANSGEIKNIAKLLNDSTAIFSEDNIQIIINSVNRSTINVSQKGSNSSGLNVIYDGTYFLETSIHARKKGKQVLPFLSEELNTDLLKKSKNHFNDIVNCFAEYSSDKIKEDTTIFEKYTGFIKGLGSLFESLTMLRNNKYYICGLVKDDTIFLYTNDPIYKSDTSNVPFEIKSWMKTVSYEELVLYTNKNN